MMVVLLFFYALGVLGGVLVGAAIERRVNPQTTTEAQASKVQ